MDTYSRSNPRPATSIMLAALLAAALLPSWTTSVSAAASSEEVEHGMEMRAAFGLPAKRSDVEALLDSSKDVGSEAYGIPMTATEVKDIDPNGRAVFSYRVRRDVLPWLEQQPEYAGAWIDQLDDGQLVVALTKSKSALVAGIDERMPSGFRGWRLVEADYSWSALEAAVVGAWSVGAKLASADDLVFSALDVQANRVLLQFRASKVDGARAEKSEWRTALGVPVHIETGQAPVDTSVCTEGNDTQANCWKPIPAGVQTRSFSVGGRLCTMGYQIYKASGNPPRQFLTAGHCVHPYAPDGSPYGNTNVYHNGSFHGGSPMGSRDATLYNASDSRDIARVTLDYANETTDKLFNWSNATMRPSTSVLADDKVFSLGVGSGPTTQSGMIKSTSTCWASETWAYNHSGNKLTVCGAWAKSIHSEPGDGGGPVFTKEVIGGDNYLTPVGIVNDNKPEGTGTMVFAKLSYAFNQWNGWEVRNPANP